MDNLVVTRIDPAAEIAVFRAFARTVELGRGGYVVLDTAPTGHTILLLDAAEACRSAPC